MCGTVGHKLLTAEAPFFSKLKLVAHFSYKQRGKNCQTGVGLNHLLYESLILMWLERDAPRAVIQPEVPNGQPPLRMDNSGISTMGVIELSLHSDAELAERSECSQGWLEGNKARAVDK